VLFTGSSEKDKRKTPPKPKHSSKLQQKQVNTSSISKGPHSAGPSVVGIDSLIDQFSFVNFSDTMVIYLFENIEFF
jgi:hypothetical protein